MVLTRAHLDALAGPTGAYANVQLQMLGVRLPPQKGWKYRLVGKSIRRDLYLHALKHRPSKGVMPRGQLGLEFHETRERFKDRMADPG